MAKTEYIRDTHKALRRYMALLLSLAVLADRIRFLPAPVRQLVLFILRPGEAHARAYVSQIALDFGVWPLLPGADGFRDANSREAAANLAVCFRAIAELVEDMIWLDLQNAANAAHPRFNASRTSLSMTRGLRRPLTSGFEPKARMAGYWSGVPPPNGRRTQMLAHRPTPSKGRAISLVLPSPDLLATCLPRRTYPANHHPRS